ncbi:hypothetical protein [Desulfomonile tiedjei]|uniref:Uncharacterized protein n=1 Tax=Desulfomonile tiedjei (strain ATCC 49306 / DSM 6799 / DCB-1) TaxID=706587 RepID=I4C5P2_DESTA|nr:hypothetical protein [Desulfomonile tiedjei]AFM24883.1 hypothetical protein Desti_2189 [Desulfomonile tiedjei DSM 6799]
MAIKTVEWSEKWVPVNKLTNIDVQFISLVPKGANQIPFQIIKADTGENMSINSVLQKLQGAVKDANTIRDNVRQLAKSANARNGRQSSSSSPAIGQLKSDIASLSKRIDALAPDPISYDNAFGTDSVSLSKADDSPQQSTSFWNFNHDVHTVDIAPVETIKADDQGGKFWPW